MDLSKKAHPSSSLHSVLLRFLFFFVFRFRCIASWRFDEARTRKINVSKKRAKGQPGQLVSARSTNGDSMCIKRTISARGVCVCVYHTYDIKYSMCINTNSWRISSSWACGRNRESATIDFYIFLVELKPGGTLAKFRISTERRSWDGQF